MKISKLFRARMGVLILGAMLITYLSIVIIAKSAFPMEIFYLLLILGFIALVLVAKGFIESKSDLQKNINAKNT